MFTITINSPISIRNTLTKRERDKEKEAPGALTVLRNYLCLQLFVRFEMLGFRLLSTRHAAN